MVYEEKEIVGDTLKIIRDANTRWVLRSYYRVLNWDGTFAVVECRLNYRDVIRNTVKEGLSDEESLELIRKL